MADPNHDDSNPPSSQPNPFGYTILPPEADLSHSRGQPILNDSLQTDLDRFFDSPDHNASALLQNPAMTDYMQNFDFTFDSHPPWSYTDQPQSNPNPNAFLQSYQHPVHQHDDYTSHNDPSQPTSTTAQQPSHDLLSGLGIEENAPPDVLKAAAKLFEYRSQKQAMLPQPPPTFATHLPSHERRPSDSMHMPVSHSSTDYTAAQFPQPNGHFRPPIEHIPAYSPPPTHPYAPQRHSFPASQPYQFGSDADFRTNGYTGAYQAVAEQGHMEFIRGIARYPGQSGAASAASSHPQSPVATRQDPQFHSHHAYPYHPVKQEDSVEQPEKPNPSKRRRTVNASSSYDGAPYAPAHADASALVNNQSSPDAEERSPAANSQSSPDPAENDLPNNPRKRRKSSSAAQAKASAAARKNLTEEQKRENHIKSEQKRRNIIRDGYKNLNDLVPNLKSGGFSKSATLTETVRELETLQAANDSARLQIQAGLGISPEELQAMMDSVA